MTIAYHQTGIYNSRKIIIQVIGQQIQGLLLLASQIIPLGLKYSRYALNCTKSPSSIPQVLTISKQNLNSNNILACIDNIAHKMYYVSILIPMVAFSSKVDLASEVSRHLHVPHSTINFYEVHSSHDKIQYALKVPSLNLNLEQISSLIAQNHKLKEQLHELKKELIKIEESLNVERTYQHERDTLFLKREVERLTGLLKSYSSNMHQIKEQAQATIQNLISSLSPEVREIPTQTDTQ